MIDTIKEHESDPDLIEFNGIAYLRLQEHLDRKERAIARALKPFVGEPLPPAPMQPLTTPEQASQNELAMHYCIWNKLSEVETGEILAQVRPYILEGYLLQISPEFEGLIAKAQPTINSDGRSADLQHVVSIHEMPKEAAAPEPIEVGDKVTRDGEVLECVAKSTFAPEPIERWNPSEEEVTKAHVAAGEAMVERYTIENDIPASAAANLLNYVRPFLLDRHSLTTSDDGTVLYIEEPDSDDRLVVFNARGRRRRGIKLSPGLLPEADGVNSLDIDLPGPVDLSGLYPYYGDAEIDRNGNPVPPTEEQIREIAGNISREVVDKLTEYLIHSDEFDLVRRDHAIVKVEYTDPDGGPVTPAREYALSITTGAHRKLTRVALIDGVQYVRPDIDSRLEPGGPSIRVKSAEEFRNFHGGYEEELNASARQKVCDYLDEIKALTDYMGAKGRKDVRALLKLAANRLE